MRFANARVLIVDDNAMNRATLDAVVRSLGVGHVEAAVDGLDALEAIARHRPDLVLLDVMMPRMDGYEMCRRLRETHPRSELPVLFVTALDDPRQRAECFAAGGSDMVTKPFQFEEISARVSLHLENRQLLAGLNEYHERVRHELAIARSVQMSLLPDAHRLAEVHRRTGIAVSGLVETSSELGGDFWTVHEPDRGRKRVAVLVADFAGHGVAAAFNVFRLHALMHRRAAGMLGAAGLLDFLNRELKSLLAPGQFAAAFVGVVDAEAGTLTYAGSAAPPPVLVSGGQARLLEAAGPPLGAFADAEFDETVVEMPEGSLLLAYSDALVESLAAGVPVVSEADLPQWVLDAATEPDPAAAIQRRFHDHLPGDPPDDLTLVCVRR